MKKEKVMALSPIGNITYINQNSQLGSIQHANNMQKVDFVLNANMQEFVDKLKDVQEVSPTPQTEAINPDSQQNAREDSPEDSKKEHKTTEFLLEEEELASYKDEVSLLDVRA